MNASDFFPPRPPATPTIYAFASTHPDPAVWKFRRYEDASLRYMGVSRH